MQRSLPLVLDGIWDSLIEGERSAKHAFHIPAVATVRDGRPRVRSVVLRGVDPKGGILTFHTDRRSPKADEIRTRPDLAWLFYDSERKIQVRVRSQATLHEDDDVAGRAWSRLLPLSRRRYGQTAAPGEPGDWAGFGLPDLEAMEDPSGVPSDVGRENFCVVRCAAVEIDWLFLRLERHSRARFWRSGNAWQSEWIAP